MAEVTRRQSKHNSLYEMLGVSVNGIWQWKHPFRQDSLGKLVNATKIINSIDKFLNKFP